MLKGFIGPIGDDLPTLLMILLSLGLFFSSIVFSFDAYNSKLDKLRLTEGAVELGRAAVSQGVVDLSAPGFQDRLNLLEKTYGLKAEVKLEPDTCSASYAFYLQYLVAAKGSAGAELKKLLVCVKKQ